MATSRQKKETTLTDLNDKFSRYKSAVFVGYSGTDVKKMENIRRELRSEGADFKIAKKTLLNLAFKNNGIKIDARTLPGQVAIALGYRDEVTPAKIIYKFSKNIGSLKILAGLFGRDFIDAAKVESLAKLPSYEELLSNVVRSMQAPISGFVNVLQGNIRGLVQVLNGISQK